MADLTGKVAVITGAKSGLGSFVTQAFLQAGASVAGVSRSITTADFNHPRFVAIPAELSSAAACEGVLDKTASQFGRIDAVVHLMGGWSGGSTLEDTDESTFDKMLDLREPSESVLSPPNEHKGDMAICSAPEPWFIEHPAITHSGL
jgi:NAD(P)-dependent dehydrogenase (short-subunit alcohol dehydrogenase family)